MTTITIGTGDLAVEVEDGASVPLQKDSMHTPERGVVRLVGGKPILLWNDIASSFVTADGMVHGGWPVKIDLAALVEERRFGKSPPVTTCRSGMPTAPDSALHLEAVGVRIKSPLAETWTHRPGNTPEKQAEFDAALNAWLWANLGDDNVTTPRALRAAARALGYGLGSKP